MIALTLNKFLLDRDTGAKKQIEDADFDGAADGLILCTRHLHMGITV